MTRGEVRRAMLELLRRFASDRERLRDPIEGLQDILRLDIQPQTRAQVQALLDQLLARRGFLTGGIQAIRAITQDGYPVDIRMEGAEAVLEDLAAQRRTIAAGSALLEILPAARLNLTYREPEPKR